MIKSLSVILSFYFFEIEMKKMGIMDQTEGLEKNAVAKGKDAYNIFIIWRYFPSCQRSLGMSTIKEKLERTPPPF
jgi:hypothetical protein